MEVRESLRDDILALIPQKPPFRFIDSIVEVGEDHIIGTYRFQPNEYFYKGHFPGRPITPGVILLETMAQTGVVALGINLFIRQGETKERMSDLSTLFTTADFVEFNNVVLPGERVFVHAKKIYLRRGCMKSDISMFKEDGSPVCRGVLAGKGVSFND